VSGITEDAAAAAADAMDSAIEYTLQSVKQHRANPVDK